MSKGKEAGISYRLSRTVFVMVTSLIILNTMILGMVWNANATDFFSDDMESGVNDWSADGLWHQSNSRYHSSSTSWAYNDGVDYDTGDHNTGSLTSPTIDLTTTNIGNLTFWTWYEVEAPTKTYDQMWIQISENSGPFVSEYQIDPSQMNSWIRVSLNITSYVGNIIRIRFFFDSIDSIANDFEGWYIDDVVVNDIPLPPETSFNPPHDDYGLDTNSDTYYNYLVVEVTVGVTESGDYLIDGSLYDTNSDFIDSTSNSTYMSAGTQIVELRFNGADIYSNGVNGPYTVDLELFDDSFELIDTDTHTTNAYQYDEFQPWKAIMEPPHSDFGLDTDSDSYYNYLVVDVVVNVSTAGNFFLFGALSDSLANPVTSDTNSTTLNEGIQTMALYFDGVDIYNNGVDGIFTVELDLYDESFVLIDEDEYTTNSYTHDEFEPPPAVFDPPHSDYGDDTNGNSYYDYLVVDVGIDVSDADTYIIDANLYNQPGTYLIVDTFQVLSLDTGVQTVQLYFNGETIYEEGIDGPYLVELTLLDTSFNILDEDSHVTQAYSYTEFEDGIPPASISDLSVDSVTTYSVRLTWTATGDDGYTGTADSYEVRYSTFGIIHGGNWNAANVFSQSWTPLPSGSTEIHDVTGLDPATEYWFAIRVADDIPNWSGVSNSPNGTTTEIFPPEIWEIEVNYNSSTVVSPGTDVTLTAVINDSEQGNSNIGGANYTVGEKNWPGTDMDPLDGTFDSPTEAVFATVDTGGWDEGAHKLYVYGWDEVPNHNTDSTDYVTVIIDSTAPEITLIDPLNSSVIKPGIAINFTFSDPYFNKTYASIDGDPKVELTDPFEINTTTWDDGEHLVELEAMDRAGNINFSWFNFTIDSKAPKIMLSSPDNESVLSADTNISLTINEDNLEKVTYSRNGGYKTELSYPFDINTSTWPDGEYTVNVYAEDKAGNFIENWFLFTKDITLPQITLKSPENNSLLMDPTILELEVTDDYLDLVRYSVNQGAYKILESPYEIDTADFEDGDFNISIRAQDTAGNMNEAWFLFTIDTTPPSVSSTFPVEDGEEIPMDADIIITFSEPMDQKSVRSAISVEPYTEYTLEWNDDNTTLTINCSEDLASKTLYTFNIGTKAKDMAGRSLDSSFEFMFTTAEEKKDDEGFPTMYLLLALIMAIVVVLIIFLMIAAKKRKAPKAAMMPTPPEVAGPQMMQVTCSSCGNLLSVEDIGVTMNVSCPFCTTLLTVESQMPQQPAPMEMPQPELPTVPITCPRCAFGFSVEDTGGIKQIQCPNCGVTGSVDLGGAGLGGAPPPPLSKAPAKPSQQIRCPSCENLFVVETTARPISIQCPHCGVTGTLT
jgi:hypothetical protein